MKEWIARIVICVLGVAGTAGVNYYMNQPEAEIGKGAAKLIKSMEDASNWTRETKGDGETVCIIRKDKYMKVTGGMLSATVHTRKKPPAELVSKLDGEESPVKFRLYEYESESSNPWMKCNTLSYKEAREINRAYHDLKTRLERVDLNDQ